MVCPIHIHHSISQYYWTFHVTLAGETGYNYSLGYWHQISNSYPKSYLNRDCNITFTISSNNIITFKENQVNKFFNIWFTKYRYINWPSPCIQGGLGWGGCNPHYKKLKMLGTHSKCLISQAIFKNFWWNMLFWKNYTWLVLTVILTNVDITRAGRLLASPTRRQPCSEIIDSSCLGELLGIALQ